MLTVTHQTTIARIHAVPDVPLPDRHLRIVSNIHLILQLLVSFEKITVIKQKAFVSVAQ
jgi:hypothetical protein